MDLAKQVYILNSTISDLEKRRESLTALMNEKNHELAGTLHDAPVMFSNVSLTALNNGLGTQLTSRDLPLEGYYRSLELKDGIAADDTGVNRVLFLAHKVLLTVNNEGDKLAKEILFPLEEPIFEFTHPLTAKRDDEEWLQSLIQPIKQSSTSNYSDWSEAYERIKRNRAHGSPEKNIDWLIDQLNEYTGYVDTPVTVNASDVFITDKTNGRHIVSLEGSGPLEGTALGFCIISRDELGQGAQGIAASNQNELGVAIETQGIEGREWAVISLNAIKSIRHITPNSDAA